MTFNEASLEEAIIELLEKKGYPHSLGETLTRSPQAEKMVEEAVT